MNVRDGYTDGQMDTA